MKDNADNFRYRASPRELSQIRDMHNRGATVDEIASVLGRREYWVYAIMHRNGMSPTKTAERFVETLDLDPASVTELKSKLDGERLDKPILVTHRRYPRYVIINLDEYGSAPI